jgi:hypothetical protein
MTSLLTQSIGARDSVDITALLYEGAFNRSPEDAGLDGWVSTLESGQLNAGGLAASIVGSAEFTALHTGQDRATIVNSFYLNVLGRPAEQVGLDGWVNSSLSLADILQGIALSPESLARNDAALHGYESAVSADALPGGAPQLETFAPPPVGPTANLMVQTHSPLDPQFLNANGFLFQGDGTTTADGFSTVVNPGNSGFLFGVEVMPRQGDTSVGNTTAGYTPLSSTFDGTTHHVVYNVPSGPQDIDNGSFQDLATRGAVNSNVVVGLDDSFDFTSFLAAGNRITMSLDQDNTGAVNPLTFEAVVDPTNGGTLDFVLPGSTIGFVDFLGTDDTASESIQQNFVSGGVGSLTEGSQFDNFLTAYDSTGQITQELHWTMLLGPAGYSPADQLV